MLEEWLSSVLIWRDVVVNCHIIETCFLRVTRVQPSAFSEPVGRAVSLTISGGGSISCLSV
jgi:hypothetical protein